MARTIVGTRSPLFYKKVAGGMPVIIDTSKFTGNVFYVDSGGGGADAAGYGHEPDKALLTIDYAIGLCTASQGDVILVLPGHSESLATLITCDIAGVSIIGLGNGNNRPQLTVTGNIDGISVTAANVTLENLYFNEATGTSATANINIAAANCTLRKIHMDLGQYDVDPITITADGERPVIEDCTAIVTANGVDTWLKFEGVVDLPIVRRNVIVGSDGTNAMDDGVIDFNSQAVTNPVVKDNVFDGGGQTLTVIANGASVVAGCYGPNVYAGSATAADNVAGNAEILDQLSGAEGIPTFPNAAVPANNVSLAEVLRSVWAGLMGTAAGENGITTWPSAAAPANAVSLAEAIRYLVENDFGTLTNTGGTATVGAILGDVAATDIATRLTNILAAIAKPGAFAWGACDAGMVGSTTTIVSDDLAGYGNDFFNGDFYMQVLFNANSATNAPEDEVRQITDYVSATGTFTCTAFSQNVEASDIILILHESQVMIGRDDNNNTAATTNVAANADGSVLEREEWIQAQIGALVNTGGTATLGGIIGDLANDSLVARLGDIGSNPDSATTDNLQGKLGTDTEMSDRSMFDLLAGDGPAAFPNAAIPANDVSLAEVLRQIYAALEGTAAGQNGVATWPASAAPASNVSIAEVLGDIWDALRNGTGGLEPGTNRSIINEIRGAALNYNAVNYLAVSADLSNATWLSVATHEVFTVTGLVRMRILIECTEDLAGAGSIQFGDETATNGIIASTTATDIDNGDIWADATPTEKHFAFASCVFDRVVNGLDIGYEITGAVLSDGTLVFHCWWEPLNASGAVAAGDGSALV